MKNEYTEPVSRLLEIGEIEMNHPWLDYREYEISSKDIPQLITMATDMELNWGDKDSKVVYAPVHAWHALGQLRAVEAVNPLINLFHLLEDDDWIYEEMPRVFEAIGPVSLPALTVYLMYPFRPYMARVIAADCINHIGSRHPEAKEECIRILMNQLKAYQKNDPTLNGFIIGYLVDLHAKQAIPLIRDAFESDRVDESFITMESVQETIEWNFD